MGAPSRPPPEAESSEPGEAAVSAPEFRVARASAEQLGAIGKLAGALVRMHHTTDPDRFLLVDRVEEGYVWWFTNQLANPNAVILVATRHPPSAWDAPEVVGYAYGSLEERDWNMLLDHHGAVHDVFVSSDVRGSGVGKMLIEALVRELEALGAERVVLHTMVENKAAQRLFASVGFRATMIEMTRSTAGDEPSDG